MTVAILSAQAVKEIIRIMDQPDKSDMRIENPEQLELAMEAFGFNDFNNRGLAFEGSRLKNSGGFYDVLAVRSLLLSKLGKETFELIQHGDMRDQEVRAGVIAGAAKNGITVTPQGQFHIPFPDSDKPALGETRNKLVELAAQLIIMRDSGRFDAPSKPNDPVNAMLDAGLRAMADNLGIIPRRPAANQSAAPGAGAATKGHGSA